MKLVANERLVAYTFEHRRQTRGGKWQRHWGAQARVTLPGRYRHVKVWAQRPDPPLARACWHFEACTWTTSAKTFRRVRLKTFVRFKFGLGGRAR